MDSLRSGGLHVTKRIHQQAGGVHGACLPIGRGTDLHGHFQLEDSTLFTKIMLKSAGHVKEIVNNLVYLRPKIYEVGQ